MKHVILFIFAIFSSFAPAAWGEEKSIPTYDIVVYGDSPGAVVAAISAQREGRSVLLIYPTKFLGGISASGSGTKDFLGCRSTFGGIASEFYDAVSDVYGLINVQSFEQHVGKNVFDIMIADAEVTVVFNEQLDRTSSKGVSMNGKLKASSGALHPDPMVFPIDPSFRNAARVRTSSLSSAFLLRTWPMVPFAWSFSS